MIRRNHRHPSSGLRLVHSGEPPDPLNRPLLPEEKRWVEESLCDLQDSEHDTSCALLQFSADDQAFLAQPPEAFTSLRQLNRLGHLHLQVATLRGRTTLA